MKGAKLGIASVLALAIFDITASAQAPAALDCVKCLKVRVGPAVVLRGPSADELDAPFSALKLDDGSFRGFSANGTTYAIDGRTLSEMSGERRAILTAGAPGSLAECGRWLTSVTRTGASLLGFVHQERACDYDKGQTDKSMAIARSVDDGLTWTDLGTVLTGVDHPSPATITGEGDCGLVDARDGYLYAYCLRNSDWQTIVARAPAGDPTDWHKYLDGAWTEPGLGGNATAIGFLGTGAAFLMPDLIATIAVDPWFGGLRLSLSADKVQFTDLAEPILPIDGADWNRPADTALLAYVSMLSPEDGSNSIGERFLLNYVYVPRGKGFESRYLVQHEVSLTVADEPQDSQVGLALTRWTDPAGTNYITSSGPLTGDRLGYERDEIVAYVLTRAPNGLASVKLAECSRDGLDQIVAVDGSCEAEGYERERTAGWLYSDERPGSVPVYACTREAQSSHFASHDAHCDGLGTADRLLGWGLAP